MKFLWLNNSLNGINPSPFIELLDVFFNFNFSDQIFLYILCFLSPLYISFRFYLTFYYTVSSWSTYSGQITKSLLTSHIKTNCANSSAPLSVLTLLILWLLLLAPISLIKSYSSLIWFNHVFVDGYSIKTTILLSVISFISLKVLILHEKSSKNAYGFILGVSLTILPFIGFMINSSTNFLTLIISVEMLSVTIILVLALLITLSFTQELAFLNSLVIFFWSSTISSISFFLFLTADYIYLGAANMTFSGFNIDWKANHVGTPLDNFFNLGYSLARLLDLIFLVIIFFKLGLPPFISWKLSFFSKIPPLYFLIYNVIYLFILLNFFFYLLILHPQFILNDLNYNVVYSLTLILAILFIAFFNQTSTLSYLLVVSTSATVLFLFWSLISIYSLHSLEYFNNIENSNLKHVKLLLILYIWTYLTIMYLLGSNLLQYFTKTLNISLVSALKKVYEINSLKATTIATTLLIILFTLVSGLPPFLTFFLKVLVVVLFQKNNFLISIFLIWIFLFTMLAFYFRNFRFLLLQSSKFYKPSMLYTQQRDEKIDMNSRQALYVLRGTPLRALSNNSVPTTLSIILFFFGIFFFNDIVFVVYSFFY